MANTVSKPNRIALIWSCLEIHTPTLRQATRSLFPYSSLGSLWRSSRLLVFSVALTVFSGILYADLNSASERGRLLIDDFESASLLNNLDGQGRAWWKREGLAKAKSVPVDRAASEASPKNHALYLEYSLPNGTRSRAGYRSDLNGVNAGTFDHLELSIKGDSNVGYATDFKVGFLRPSNARPDMIESGSFVVTGIGDEWQQFRLPLNKMNGIQDWSNLSEFVIEGHERRTDAETGAIYADDISFIKTNNPGPSAQDPVIPVKKRKLEHRLGGPAAMKRYLAERFRFDRRSPHGFSSIERDDDQAFVKRVARDTWEGIAAMVDQKNGLPVDNVRFPDVESKSVEINDYTNITNVGLYMMSVVGAARMDFISRDEAAARLTRLFATLDQLETRHGFFFNYYDTTTLERTSNLLSFVDSSWLTAGLMVVRSAHPELANRASRMINTMDYGWLYDDVEQLMSHGYYVNLDYPSEYHYGMLYTETRTGSLIAIGKGDVPLEHWFRMHRTFPKEERWQSQEPRNRQTRIFDGYEIETGNYSWRGQAYVPSWGGSMFEALMPTLVVDEQRYAPDSLGLNNKRHVEIQRRFAIEELGYPVWGLSPSALAAVDGYSEFGVGPLGARGYEGGVVTPHATMLALTIEPKAATDNLRELLRRYPVYGPYGFFDSVDPKSGAIGRKYLLLDQAMSFVSAVNFLTEGAIQNYFAADPVAEWVLAEIGKERFFN